MNKKPISVNLTMISRKYIDNLPEGERKIAEDWYQTNQELISHKLFEAAVESGAVARLQMRATKRRAGGPTAIEDLIAIDKLRMGRNADEVKSEWLADPGTIARDLHDIIRTWKSIKARARRSG